MMGKVKTINVTPYMRMDLLGEADWLEEREDQIPSGIVEVTSPVTSLKETYFLSFDKETPPSPVDVVILEKLITHHVKTTLIDRWTFDGVGADIDVPGLIKEVTWKDLCQRLDIITYEYQPHKAFPLYPGVWVSYGAVKEAPPTNPLICNFLANDQTYPASLVTLKKEWVEQLYDPGELLERLRLCAGAHFETEITLVEGVNG